MYDYVVLSVVLGLGLAAAVTVAAYALRERRRLTRELSEARAGSRTPVSAPLGKRTAFIEDLEQELRRCARTGRPASLVIVRLSPGRPLGQSPGQSRGEIGRPVRPDLPAVIAGAVRSIDVAYRIGHNEIALIVPETRARGALLAAARLEERLLAAGVPSGMFTAGVAELGPGVDRTQLCREAYCAVVVAGIGGRPRILTYSPELERAARAQGLRGPGEVESFGEPSL